MGRWFASCSPSIRRQMRSFRVDRDEWAITDRLNNWEWALTNKRIDRVLSRRESKALRNLAMFLYISGTTDLLVEYDEYC